MGNNILILLSIIDGSGDLKQEETEVKRTERKRETEIAVVMNGFIVCKIHKLFQKRWVHLMYLLST